jgi:hypothetical protein
VSPAAGARCARTMLASRCCASGFPWSARSLFPSASPALKTEGQAFSLTYFEGFALQFARYSLVEGTLTDIADGDGAQSNGPWLEGKSGAAGADGYRRAGLACGTVVSCIDLSEVPGRDSRPYRGIPGEFQDGRC